MLQLGSRRRLAAWGLIAGLAAGASAAHAATCNVPSGSYPTIAAALGDPACDPIQIAAGAYTTNLFIARDVSLNGAGSGSTTIAGWVEVSGAATDAVLNALRIDASSASSALCDASDLDVRGGARASGLDLVVARPAPATACTLFADGFESGGSTRWSTAVP